jgi:phosphatidylethanolamine-binding protein (PEBP) family uncharacterized protein
MIVTYSKNIKVTNKKVRNLSKNDTATAPKIDFGNLLEKDKYYTLIMHDPDAVNNNHNVNHWIINNIQSNSTFDTFLAYKGPHPPPGSGIHKYIFNLYLQPNGISNTKITLTNDNRSIPVPNLLAQLQLTNENLVSSVYFTCTAPISGGKRSRRRKSRRRKGIKSRRQK